MRSGLYPRRSLNTLSVCSPRSGGGVRRLVGWLANLTGAPISLMSNMTKSRKM